MPSCPSAKAKRVSPPGLSSQHWLPVLPHIPKHFAANPKLPAQIRWSLSHDEALARDLAKYLNASFEQFLAKATEHYVELFSDRLLVDLQRFHLAVAEALKFADRVWKVRPSPMKLANQDLSVAHARMMKESAERVVLYSHEPGAKFSSH